ncbi:hypothetical protein [Pseudooceanicola sp.]|uniref:hypothetical protein n=1 Tax=Pseudooceanicola sp. TaxID=1914328 RepID=UPI002602A6B8|nr:hypothetical protein [Pseudooceanicola sp.]
MLGFLALQLGLTLYAGALRFDRDAGDMLHLADLVLRMTAGQVPHQDFMTPIGDLAIRPFAVLLSLPTQFGIRWQIGLGQALLWGQILAALVLLPAVIWTGVSRLPLWLACGFGVAVLGMVTANTYGGSDPNLSLLAHSNRWAWALTSLVVVLVVVPARCDRADVRDGLIIGLALAALVLIKADVALALLIPVGLGLLIQFRARVMWVGILAALAVWAGYSLIFGLGYWLAYFYDLSAGSHSSLRPWPSASLVQVILSPAYAPASLLALIGAWLLRRESRGPGLTLLILLPAFAHIAFQNIGNDPIWLLALAICLLAQLPASGEGPRLGLGGVALGALVLLSPIMLNLLVSPLRHAFLPRDQYAPVFSTPIGADLQILTDYAGPARMAMPLRVSKDIDPAMQTLFLDRTLPDCTLTAGLIAETRDQAATLRALKPALQVQPFVADYLAPHWLFAPLAPLQGGAPWYYEGLPGFANASHLLVPDCPANPSARQLILSYVEEIGVGLHEVHQGAGFSLYAIDHAPGTASAAKEDAQD